MDLPGWSSNDFEPSLLRMWSDDADPTIKSTEGQQEAVIMRTNSVCNDGIDGIGGPKSPNLSYPWNFEDDGISSLGQTGLKAKIHPSGGGGGSSNVKNDLYASGSIPTSVFPVLPATHAGVAISETTSVTSTRDDSRSATTGSSTSSYRTPSSFHPLGMQASAKSLPPPRNASTTQPTTWTASTGGSAHSSDLKPPSSYADLYSADLSEALERSNMGLMAASAATSNPQFTVLPGMATPKHHHLLTMLTNNFMLATAGTVPSPAAAPTASSFPLQTNHANFPPSHSFQHPSSTTLTRGAPVTSSVGLEQQPASSKTQSSSSTRTSTPSLPPFYLFDAPMELRANFMQNQRKLGLPVEHDPNSFYYGETVNGYHPQQDLKNKAFSPEQAANLLQVEMDPTKVGLATLQHNHNHLHNNSNPPQMIDARHGWSNRRSRNGKQKNEREQKRAQKITELIDQLRVQLEDGGWQTEGRSKFNTLSKCADYVKHMNKIINQKEEELEKLKSDLEMKKRQAEEDKAMQEARSDPESVMSSLTSNTNGSRTSRNGNSRVEQSGDDNQTKRKAMDTNEDHECALTIQNVKKHKREAAREATEDSYGEDREAASGSGSGSGGDPSAQATSLAKTVSTVSDLTDSNQCSSNNNSRSAQHVGCDNGQQPSSNSISSDAAVANEKKSRDRHTGHKDVVFKNGNRARKQPLSEAASLETNFELDYEEVFDKSNIPQLIASTSGKIIKWNQCFAKASGYRKSVIENLSIFSLVRPDKLANFFDIVATALRPNEKAKEDWKPRYQVSQRQVSLLSSVDSKAHETDDENEHTKLIPTLSVAVTSEDRTDKLCEDAVSSNLTDYTAITLPCIDFPAMKKRNQSLSDSDVVIAPLTVTVTLMADEDPQKRCFHCVFTNCRGTGGALGSITPELLACLFATPLRRRHKHLRSHHKHNLGPPKSIDGPVTDGGISKNGEEEVLE